MRVLTTAEGDIVTLRDTVNGTLNEIYIYGKSVQNGTPTHDSPVAIESFDGAEVACIGRNMADFSRKQLSFANGGKISSVGDSALVTLSNIAPADLSANSGGGLTFDISGFYIPDGQPLYASYLIKTNASRVKIGAWQCPSALRWYQGVQSTAYFDVKPDSWERIVIPFRRDVRYPYVAVMAHLGDYGNGAIAEIKDFQISTTATPYEPYKEPSVLPIPYTLRGLKVASGGNYTDSDGQQWVSDYLHLWKENGVVKGERVEAVGYTTDKEAGMSVFNKQGVDKYGNVTYQFVMNLGSRLFKGTLDEKQGGIISNYPVGRDSNRSAWVYDGTTLVFASYEIRSVAEMDAFRANNTIEVVGIANEPTTTAIPTDQATAMLNALKTYKPTTNVIGSKPCGLSVQYKAQAPGEVELDGSSPLVLPYVGGSALKSLYLTGGEITQDGVPTPDSPKPILIGGKELRVNDAGVAYVDGQEVVIGEWFVKDYLENVNTKHEPSSSRVSISLRNVGASNIRIETNISPNGSTSSWRYAVVASRKPWIQSVDIDTVYDSGYQRQGGEFYVADAEYIIITFRRVGDGSDDKITKSDVGELTFSVYDSAKPPYRIPIPLLIGSDTAEIAGNNPVSKGVNLNPEDYEEGYWWPVTSGSAPHKASQGGFFRMKTPTEVKPNTNYFVKVNGSNFGLMWLDGNGVVVGNPSINTISTSPSNARYFVAYSIGTPSENHICISESNPFTNGLYFPYEAEPQSKV